MTDHAGEAVAQWGSTHLFLERGQTCSATVEISVVVKKLGLNMKENQNRLLSHTINQANRTW